MPPWPNRRSRLPDGPPGAGRAARSTVRCSLPDGTHAHSVGMPKPPTKKRSPSEIAEEKALAAEEMLRKAALAYAEVAKLDPSDPRWRRCWRALLIAAFRVAEAL